jgi:hypothetical protein
VNKKQSESGKSQHKPTEGEQPETETMELLLPNIIRNSRIEATSHGRFLHHVVQADLEQIGAGQQLVMVLGLVFGSAALLLFLVWLMLRPYQERRRRLVAAVPTTKTIYTARYELPSRTNGATARDTASEVRTCRVTLIFRHECDAGWRVTGTSMGERCMFVRGRISTFGTVELELGEGGMYITGVYDPDSGTMAGEWQKTKRAAGTSSSSKKKSSFAITLVPESARNDLPAHASIV